MAKEKEDAARSGRGPVIGWEQESPVDDAHQFNSYLHVSDGKLIMDDLDLSQKSCDIRYKFSMNTFLLPVGFMAISFEFIF